MQILTDSFSNAIFIIEVEDKSEIKSKDYCGFSVGSDVIKIILDFLPSLLKW